MNITTVPIGVLAAVLGELVGCTTLPHEDTRIRCWKVPVGVTSYGVDSGLTTPEARRCESGNRR